MATAADRVLSRTTRHTIDWASEELGMSYAQVGKAVGANRRTVYRWRNAETTPSPPHQERLEKLQQLEFLLSSVFADSAAAQEWLRTPIGALQGLPPSARLREGQVDDLIQILATFHAGAFI